MKMKMDLAGAKRCAESGQIQAWVLEFLSQPDSKNCELKKVIESHRPIWIGPIEVEIGQLKRCCGPEKREGNGWYHVVEADWNAKVECIVTTLGSPEEVPPLIVRQQNGVFGIPDGNHRHEAMRRKRWPTCWVLLWGDRDESLHNNWSPRKVVEVGPVFLNPTCCQTTPSPVKPLL